LIKQQAVQVNDKVITDPNYAVRQGETYTVKVGKRRFLKLN